MSLDNNSGFIDPKETEIQGQKFVLSKVPATVALRIFEQWATSKIPFLKLGDYAFHEKLRYELLTYTAVRLNNGEFIRLAQSGLIDAHIKDHIVLKALVEEMREYNQGFLEHGSFQILINSILEKLPATTSEILMGSWQRLLETIKQHTTS